MTCWAALASNFDVWRHKWAGVKVRSLTGTLDFGPRRHCLTCHQRQFSGIFIGKAKWLIVYLQQTPKTFKISQLLSPKSKFNGKPLYDNLVICIVIDWLLNTWTVLRHRRAQLKTSNFNGTFYWKTAIRQPCHLHSDWLVIEHLNGTSSSLCPTEDFKFQRNQWLVWWAP